MLECWMDLPCLHSLWHPPMPEWLWIILTLPLMLSHACNPWMGSCAPCRVIGAEIVAEWPRLRLPKSVDHMAFMRVSVGWGEG